MTQNSGIIRVTAKYEQKLEARALAEAISKEKAGNPERIYQFIIGGFSGMTDRQVRAFIEVWSTENEDAFQLDGRGQNLSDEDLIKIHMRRWRAEPKIRQAERIMDIYKIRKRTKGYYL